MPRRTISQASHPELVGSPQIEIVPITRLRANSRNARTHSEKQIRQIAESFKRFRVINPIIADRSGTIICGHARYRAGRLLGLDRLPVIRVSHLSDAELRLYMLADNRLAESAGWDRSLLAVEFEELQIALPELDIGLSITGFEPQEIDSILGDLGTDNPRPADELPAVEEKAVSRVGDLFVLGKHRLLVGDARDQQAYTRLMGRERVTMAFLDPPYNVKITGHVGGRGRIRHREFAVASGELTPAQFTVFLRQTLGHCGAHLTDGAIAYVCMDWRHAGELLEAGRAVFGEPKNVCVWVKTTPGQGSFYRSQHELVFVFKKGEAPHINTFELGQHGRTRSNVWTYPGANTFRAGRLDDLKMHPTVKPVALIKDAMLDCSKRGSIVLDVFAGSGTSIAAAETVGRRAFCIEIDPLYADVAIRRWQRLTGRDAVLQGTDQTFNQLAESRHVPAQPRANSDGGRR
jgi:DNA modification methylase